MENHGGQGDGGGNHGEIGDLDLLRRDADEMYFNHYCDVWVHRLMIQDTPRMLAYKSAVDFHREHITGKVIVDVGCGTGILSIYCALAGARKVYAIEASKMALLAERIVEDNRLSEVITVLQGKVEDVTIEEKADVIISEWMGDMLFRENMLPTIISARDRWLTVGGLILPTVAKLYIAPFSDSARHHNNIEFWSDVDGINMSALINPTKAHLRGEGPMVDTVEQDSLLAIANEVMTVNMDSVTMADLSPISATFTFTSERTAPLHGFVLWFDVGFSANALVRHDELEDELEDEPEDVRGPVLSTSPEAPATHWQQTFLDCYDSIPVEENQVISGTLEIQNSESNHRVLNICLKYRVHDGEFRELLTTF